MRFVTLSRYVLMIMLTLFSLLSLAQNNQTDISTSDNIISTEIRKKINDDPSLTNQDIQVVTKGGVVHFSGKVKSDTDATNLIEIAESTLNVKDVDVSDLHIETSKQPLTDVIISGKIKGLFIKENLFGPGDIPSLDIQVETKNGVVYLSGTASNQEQINTAISSAKSVANVKEVISTIKIGK